MAQNTMDVFKKIAASGGEAYLLNVYKGIPISVPAKILSVSDNSLRVVTDNYQTVCMFIEKKTFIQSEWLTEVLKADVVEMSATERIATLTNFRPVDSGVGNRNQVRIQPKDPLEGSIQNVSDSRTVKGELADISQDGLAIYLIAGTFGLSQFYKGTYVTINLTLPGEFTVSQAKTGTLPDNAKTDRFARENVRFTTAPGPKAPEPTSKGSLYAQRVTNPKLVIRAVVAYARPEGAHTRTRVGMHILPNDPVRPLLAQFIAQRQSEIIREIKMMYDLLAKLAAK
jgi:hypothetical protein